MNNPLFSLLWVGITTTFMALLISTVFKYFLIPKYADTFSQTLKYSLSGGGVGMIIFYVIWYFNAQESGGWEPPGIIGSIPFYTMLAGQLIGVYTLNRKTS